MQRHFGILLTSMNEEAVLPNMVVYMSKGGRKLCNMPMTSYVHLGDAFNNNFLIRALD